MTVFEVTRILHELNECLNSQVKIIEDLVDRVSSLEQCARVTPTEEERSIDEGNSKMEAAGRDNPFRPF